MVYKKISAQDVTDVEFEQMVDVEMNSDGDPCSEKELDATIKHSGNDNFVCINDGKIIAFATLNSNSRRLGGSIYIVNLSVRKEFQRQGIAKNIFKTACDFYIKQYKDQHFTLHVSKDNIRAIGLYNRLGFEIREDLVEDAEDYGMAILVKKLYKNFYPENIKK